MNIPPSEARAFSYRDYQAILWHWNDSHDLEDDHPDPALTMKLIDEINADPRLVN